MREYYDQDTAAYYEDMAAAEAAEYEASLAAEAEAQQQYEAEREAASVNAEPTEPALPQSLVDAAAIALRADAGYSGNYWEWEYGVEQAKIALQAAGVPALLATLQGIANANPTDWRDDFHAWAQNRARHTLRQVLDDDYKKTDPHWRKLEDE